jgi:hypothetical protein
MENKSKSLQASVMTAERGYASYAALCGRRSDVGARVELAVNSRGSVLQLLRARTPLSGPSNFGDIS